MKPGFQMVPAGPYYSIGSIHHSVNKMYRKSTAVILITLLVASSAAGLGLAGAQPLSTSQQVAETLLSVLDNSHGEVTSLFESVASDGTVSEGAQDAYDEAVQLRTQAQDEYDLSEYGEAVKTATKALNMYGRAAGKIFEEAEVEVEPEDDDTEEYLGLFVAHEKSVERLEKLTAIAEDLTEQGIDASETTTLIEEAQENLDAMGSALDAGEFESAEELLDDANGLMGQTTGSLQSQSNQKKKEKTEKFIVKTKSMVQNLETKLDSVLDKYNVSEEDADTIRDQFQEMKDKLDVIDLDEEGDLDDVIDDLKDIIKDSEDVGDDEDELDEEVVKSLKEINKHESKLERYRERVEELDLLGIDTTGLDSLVEDAEEALAEALTGTDDGDEDATEDLIDNADDILDDLDDLIDDVEDEVEDLEEDDVPDKEEDETGEDEPDDESDDTDMPDDGDEETGDDDSDDEEDETDESDDESDDNGNGGDDPDDDVESSFEEVLEQVNYFIQIVEANFDLLAEREAPSTDLEIQLAELIELLEGVEDTDDLVEIEEEVLRIYETTSNLLGIEVDPEVDLHPGDGVHPEDLDDLVSHSDDDIPDDESLHDDSDDHDDDHGDDDEIDDHGDDHGDDDEIDDHGDEHGDDEG